MADDTDTPTPAATPRAPRRRAAAAPKSPRKPRATAAKADAPAGTATAAAPRKRAAAKPAAAPKPRSTKRASPAPKRRAPAKATEDTSGKSSGWGTTAAVVGGLAAVGAAATAALLSLRGSTPKPSKPKSAHTPDGKDASKSFDAGIADQNSVPDEG